MISAHTRRSIRELTRRKARSVLTILTIVGAIAGIWLFAIPGNIDASLNRRAETDGMHAVRLAPELVTSEQAAELRAVANVASLDIRTLGGTEMRVGDRTQWTWLIGVDDFENQSVNIVSVEEGALPSTGNNSSPTSKTCVAAATRGPSARRCHSATRTEWWIDFEVPAEAGRSATAVRSPTTHRSCTCTTTTSRRSWERPAPTRSTCSLSIGPLRPRPAMVDELRSTLTVQDS